MRNNKIVDMSDPATDVRPIVASPASQRSVWLFSGGVALGALLIFQALESHRATITAPAIAAPNDSDLDVSSSPILTIPAEPAMIATFAPASGLGATKGSVTFSQVEPVPLQQRAVHFQPAIPPSAIAGSGQAFPSYVSQSTNPANIAVRQQNMPQSFSERFEEPSAAAAENKDRVKATRFLNPATTVPKGTVIQAVLESALDSTRGGFVRALVSRDIHGFDGSHVLIQRGSRILGEYKSDVSLGQKRILIQWQRLTRPDGVIIDLDSPSADPLGRAGTGGKVDTHFFQRFAAAFLQSSLNIGMQLAARAASHDTIVLALPGSVQQGVAGQETLQPERIAPTVTVKQGTSVSVFVAKDLDFTDTDQ